MMPSSATIANRYDVLESLGNGAFCSVFKVKDRTSGEILALKRLPHRNHSPQEIRRFQREFRLLSRLRHPHIVSVKDAGADGDGLFFTMEYLHGVTLAQILESPETPLCRDLRSGSEALRQILVQICEALACIHAQGMVHRDLKPANVFIQTGESGPQVKILDLGMVKFGDDGQDSLTEEGIMLGTVHYMSPEQIRAVHVDARADLYMLGVMLYEILAGQKPFEGSSSAAVILQHLTQIPVPPRVHNLDIPHDLQLVVVKLLEKEPERRYRSAEDLLDDLIGAKMRPAKSGSFAPTLASQARFLGRRTEMNEARAMLADVLRNEGRMLTLSGDPGIGKTRFLEELMADAHIKGIQVLSAACFADRSAPFLPIVECFQAARKLLGSLDAWVRDENREELARLFPELSAGEEKSPLSKLRQTDQTALFHALLQLFEDVAHRAPVMFCLDDIQWADRGTLDFIGFLSQHLDALPVFLCVAHRPFELDRSGWKVDIPSIALSPLDRVGIAKLLASLFATVELPENLIADVSGLSGGNPLFAHEITETLASSKAVVWESNQWVYRPQPTDLPKEATAILDLRLDDLPEDAHLPLAYASVVNRPFSFDLISAVMGGDEDALFDALEQLVRQNFLSKNAQDHYGLFHSLIGESICKRLAADQMAALHRDVGLALSELEFSDEAADEIARHLLAGHLHDEAVPYLMKAGSWALRTYVYRDAQRHYEQALQIAEADEAAFADVYSEILCNYVESLTFLGEWDLVRELAEKGLQKSTLTDLTRGRLSRRLGMAFGIKGDYGKAEELFLEALQYGEKQHDELTVLGAWMNLVNAYWFTGQYDQATQYVQSAFALCQASSDVFCQAIGHFLMGNDHLTHSRYADAETDFQEALAAFEALSDKKYVLLCQGSLREIYTYRGRLKDAEEISEHLLSFYETSNEIRGAYEMLDLGYIYFQKGELERAEAQYRSALEGLGESKQRQKLSLAYVRFAELLIQKDDPQQALEYATQAANIVEEEPIRGSQVFRVSGMCHAALGALDEAAAHFEKSIAVLDGFSGLQLALALFESGKFHLSVEHESLARDHIDRALALFETMGADLFLKEAQEIKRKHWETPRIGQERPDMEPLPLKPDRDRLLDEAIDRLLQMTQADRGMILTVHNGKPRIQSACSRHLDASSIADISMSVVQAAIEARTLIVTSDAAQDPRFQASQSIADHHIGSVLCMPLKAHDGHVIGAIYADHQGAARFSPKDIDSFKAFGEFVGVALENALRYHKLQEDLEKLAGIRTQFGDMVGTSAAMQAVYEMVERLSATDVTVLLQGETGTGKGLMARTIHTRSDRADGPFLMQNCGALPGELLESELFGHSRGAFTGASFDRQGIFEAANGGTVCLDEIGDAPPEVQVRLLQVLEEGQIRRVGENQMREVDVRIIAATNRNLEEEVKAGRFRQDLYFRLKVVPIVIAPLRERPEDILLLANHFLDFWSETMRKETAGFAPEVQDAFLRYRWPGNIRELKNEVQRGVLLVEPEGQILVRHLSDSVGRLGIGPAHQGAPAGSLKTEVARFERGLMLAALEENGWNITHTAKKLGLSRVGFKQKMKKYGIAKSQSGGSK